MSTRQFKVFGPRLLFESQTNPPAEESRKSHVRSTENRLEIVEKQLVCQVLNVKLDVHRHSFFLHQVGAY